MDDQMLELYDYDNYLSLPDDDNWVYEYAMANDISPRHVSYDDLCEQAAFERDNDLEELACEVDARLAERVRELHPEWGGRVLVMATGVVQRWDGWRRGHNYYGSFSDLLADTGREGVLADCHVDRVSECRDGTLCVRGVHHDGAVEVAVRAVDPGTQQAEDDWDGPDEGRLALLQARWDEGVGADMAGYVGHVWRDPEPRATRAAERGDER